MKDKPFSLSRRALLSAGVRSSLALACMSVMPRSLAYALHREQTERWLSEALVITRRLRKPSFPLRERTLDVRALSSLQDPRQVVQNAIDEFARDGGGIIRLAAGEWSMCGPLRLKSNIRLHLQEGANVIFSDDPDHYLPPVLTRWEGTETFGYSPFIYSYQAHNVAITGAGRISVRSSASPRWRSFEALNQWELRRSGRSGAPVYDRVHDDDGALAPSLIQFFGCSSVLVEGITTADAPFWGIHLVYSSDVTIQNVTVRSTRVNNDGIDIDSSDHVLVERCVFETGDDCIAIKSGRDLDGRSIGNPSESIVIRNCVMNHGKSAALALGSEMSGGIRGVYFYDCAIRDVDTVLDVKSNLDRGGVVERIRAWNLSVDRCETFFEVTTVYHGYAGGNFVPTLRDISIAQSSISEAKLGLQIKGAAESPVTDISLSDVIIRRCDTPVRVSNAQRVHLFRFVANGVEVTV
jgi:polygalacturonase